MSSTARDLERWLASTHGWPTARPAWRTVVADFIDARVAPRDRDAALARASGDSDFHVCALGGELSARSAASAGRRRGRFVVQLDEWSDAASDARTNRSDARCRRPGGGRCLRVSLTDGRNRFIGHEYGVVEALSGEGMRAGAKLALTDPYVDEEGRIWLENETCEALGGCVERLERARMRVLEVLEAPNRPGVVVGDRFEAAAKSAWREERETRAATAATATATTMRSREETRAVMDREPLAMNSLGSSGRGSDATPTSPKVVPVSLVPDSLGATELDENMPPADARGDGGRASEPASSTGLERDSIPSMPNDVALAGRARDVARRLNETAVKGLWTYVAAVKSARAEGVDDKSTNATVHGWITRIGTIEVKTEDASRGKMWRLKIQVSDSTGATTAFLRFAQLDAVAESTAAAYDAASAREKKTIEDRVRRRLEEFCGRIKLSGLRDRIMHVAKLDVQPTSFKSSVVEALDARAREFT